MSKNPFTLNKVFNSSNDRDSEFDSDHYDSDSYQPLRNAYDDQTASDDYSSESNVEEVSGKTAQRMLLFSSFQPLPLTPKKLFFAKRHFLYNFLY